MNKFNRYILQYQTNNKICELIYRLTDNPITELWSNIVYKHYEEGKNIFSGIELDVNAYDLELLNKENNWKIIVENCNYLDSIDYPYKEMFNLCNSEKIYTDKSTLNFIHKKFHFISEKFQIVTDVIGSHIIAEKLSQINVAIHRIENSEWLKNPVDGFVNVTLRESYKHSAIIDDTMCRNFCHSDSLKTQPGDIWLSYGTIGKTLWDCYKDNDIDLVKEIGIRPKRTIQSEHTISFVDRVTTPHTSLQLNCMRVSKWLKDNNLEKYVNPYQSAHYYSEYPLLAQLENNIGFGVRIQPEELNNIFLKANFIGFRID